MKLMTKELEKKLSKYPFGSQEDAGANAFVLAKYFGGCTYTALVTEAEKQEDGDWLFFGIVTLDGSFWEWGYFCLSEIEQLRFPPFRLPAERDLYISADTKVSDIV